MNAALTKLCGGTPVARFEGALMFLEDLEHELSATFDAGGELWQDSLQGQQFHTRLRAYRAWLDAGRHLEMPGDGRKVL